MHNFLNKIKNLEKRVTAKEIPGGGLVIAFRDGTHEYRNEFFDSFEKILEKYPVKNGEGFIILPARDNDHSNIN